MTDGYIEKSLKANKTDLEKIKEFTQTDIDENELFIFSVILCNNDIDRDFEKFSINSLNELKTLFVGKTGIKDHSMKASDQMARIFDTSVEKISNRKTLDGEPFYVLKAKAYMVKNKENESLIKEIEAGIKKEVSISCAMEKNVCSICGKNKRYERCNHINGKKYDNKLCFSVLSNAKDAYEWSFVAVPAQREAGVTKSFNFEKGKIDMNEITKCLKSENDEVVISKKDAQNLYSYIEDIEESAKLGEEYKKSLYKELIKLCTKAFPELDIKTFKSVASIMTTKELLAFKDAFERSQALKNMPSPQLSKVNKNKNKNYNEFKI